MLIVVLVVRVLVLVFVLVGLVLELLALVRYNIDRLTVGDEDEGEVHISGPISKNRRNQSCMSSSFTIYPLFCAILLATKDATDPIEGRNESST
jgi:hypothetical protein